MTLETERLIIDPIRETDREDYFLNISHDKKVLETFICNYAESIEDFSIAPYVGREDLFAVRLKETGRLIGIILYFDAAETSCEIGYGLGSAHWGRGYASEAAARFIRFLFEEKGFKSVCASYFTGNDASRRVMEKCGMAFSRFSPKELEYLGVERDLTYYEIRRSERRENMIVVNVTYKCLPGMRDAFLEKIAAEGIAEASRAEQGNIQYAYFIPAAGGDELLLVEKWRDPAALIEHAKTPHYARLGELKPQYVADTVIEKFELKG